MDEWLARRLVDAGVDPANPGDAWTAWLRLYENEGARATLVDCYAIAADRLGLSDPAALPREVRDDLVARWWVVRYPDLELNPEQKRGDPIEVVPYDPEWPAVFERWRDALIAALGRTAVRVEHVGSTAIPGLAAKPVIDIQASVPDAEDEASYVAPIESTGVALRSREPGHRYFRPPPDRLRDVHVHVCTAGGDWEREHLLFRDYLRAHGPARRVYATMKQELAERYRDDRLAYTEAKTAFILDALKAAPFWAERSGWRLPPPINPPASGTA